MNCYDIERKDRCMLSYTVLHQGQPPILINYFWDVFWLMFLPLSLLLCILIALLLENLFDCMISLELILLYEAWNCCSMLTVSHVVKQLTICPIVNQQTYIYSNNKTRIKHGELLSICFLLKLLPNKILILIFVWYLGWRNSVMS